MKAWRVVLVIYLILCGVYWLVPTISFPFQGILMGILAIVTGILLITDR
jgi:uncharacterized membrane protein HdeD (DUF308 family)